MVIGNGIWNFRWRESTIIQYGEIEVVMGSDLHLERTSSEEFVWETPDSSIKTNEEK